ncbi:S-layer homology domain-containing protein [Anaerovorax odorimutans]|uniref:S-layer homology domain-containing protein n=1 Tax=Anaerovorax odorimutans TaxID=109327 RepID=UPI0004254E97|nr:S-layer homology domain-containing protein [Anaerovorax odorimutans]
MKMKKLSCLLLALVMISTLSLPMNVSGYSKFSDIRGHWAEQYINKAVSEGIIEGYKDGTFKPNNAVTRAEFISMVNRALGCTGTANITFNDVSYSKWYYSDITKAIAATYVAGYSSTSFKPNNPISRQEVAVMISRFVPTHGYNGNLRAYSDYMSVSNWAYTAFSKINGKGYLGAYSDGKLHPLDSLTRAQTAKILCDIVDKENIVTSDPVVKKDGTRLSNKIYSNNVTIHKYLDDDDMSLENCVVLGTLKVQGGGTDTVTVENCRIANSDVDKSSEPVRVLAMGETTIVNLSASNDSILQTSGLDNGTYGLGFAKVNINNSADTTLRGRFPKVFISGTSSDTTLESGSIDELTVENSGKRSEITIDSDAKVSKAVVNAESSFKGSGTISEMDINSDDVTYETRPKKVSVKSNVDDPEESDSGLTITFDPSNKEKRVDLDTDITIKFNTAVTKYNGNKIYDSDISDFISLRKSSISGRSISFDASINNSKRTITLEPDDDLDDDTKYYIVIDSRSVKDSDGNSNSREYSYFYTGDSTDDDDDISFSPSNKSTSVSLDPDISIEFPEAVVTYRGGKSLSKADIDDIISFEDSDGSDIRYDVSKVTSKRIVITPRHDLDVGTRYEVSINSKSLKYASDGDTVPDDSVYWTTEGDPALSNFSTSAYEKSVKVSAKSNLWGRLYAVAISTSASSPSASQVVSGRDGNGTSAVSANNVNIYENSYATVELTGLSTGTTYKIYAVLKDDSGNLSSISSATITTKESSTPTPTPPAETTTDIKLSKLTISNSENFNFSPTVYTYNNVLVPYGTSSVTVSADAGNFVGTLTVNDSKSPAKVSIEDGEATVTVSINELDKTPREYTVHIKEKGSADLSKISINGTGYTIGDTFALASPTTSSVTLNVEASDSRSSITIDNKSVDQEEDIVVTLSISEDAPAITLKITSYDGLVKTYPIKFSRPSAP